MADIFYNISEKNKEKLLRFFEANSILLKKNVNLTSSINRDNLIGFIQSGYMQVIRTDYNGNRTIIEELEENSVFGTVISSLTNKEYQLIAKEDTKIFMIEYSRIISDTECNYTYYNQFIKNLLEIITTKVKEKNERIAILTKKTIRDKLLEYFQIMNNKNASKIIYITLGFTDLADYLAVDRSAMSREIKNLIEEGFIKKDGKKITLLY